MKHETRILVSFDVWEKLDSLIRDEIIAIYPPGHVPGSRRFFACFSPEDPRVAEILKLLGRVGLTTWRHLNDKAANEFSLIRIRHYDAEDFESFSLLENMGDPKLQNYIWPAADGTLQVKQPYFKRKKLVDVANIHSLLVSVDIRAGLEQAGFRGMVFKPVVPQEKDAVVPLDNLWELTSDQRMPPLSDYCTFFDDQGTPVKGSAETGYQYIEDFYPINELHYPAGSVRAWPWDFALTHELFSYGGTRHRRRLVVSKRFYNFCQERKLKLEWIPVRVDPD